MSVAKLIDRAGQAGLTVRLADGKLKLTGLRAAVERWMPHLLPHREELIAILANAIEWREERAAILAHDAGLDRAAAEQEAAKLHAKWRRTHRVYLQHHWGCPVCIAAGQGRGLRCGTGTALWANYQEAPRAAHRRN